ncbi:MAG: hypothetical protein JO198_10925 [Candidatus Dormibacteraeota bacterium]|nr:hypothetical protein [Candidatus Dormibacteraeota bacterium]
MPEMRPRVLIAHEEPMVARILEHKLRREGHEVTCVRDAGALAGAMRDGGADVLLLDTRVAPRPPEAPAHGWFAMIEARDEAGAHAAMQEGAAGLVRLPFKPTDVAAQVSALLAMVRA